MLFLNCQIVDRGGGLWCVMKLEARKTGVCAAKGGGPWVRSGSVDESDNLRSREEDFWLGGSVEVSEGRSQIGVIAGKVH